MPARRYSVRCCSSAPHSGGDSRVYVNIGLVAIIAPLGFLAATKRYKTGVVPKNLILTHAGLAVIFYLLLVAVVAGVKVIG